MASPLHLRARARRFVPAGGGPAWLLGASVLAAFAVAGCGSAGDSRGNVRAALHATEEQHLLGLIASARNDASANNGVGVEATLSQFITQVSRLRSSGELTTAAAAGLDRQALATEAQAARQLHPATRVIDVGALNVARELVQANSRRTRSRPSAPVATSDALSASATAAPADTVPAAPPPTPPSPSQRTPSTAPGPPSPIHRNRGGSQWSGSWHHDDPGYRRGGWHHGGPGHWTAWNGGSNS